MSSRPVRSQLTSDVLSSSATLASVSLALVAVIVAISQTGQMKDLSETTRLITFRSNTIVSTYAFFLSFLFSFLHSVSVSIKRPYRKLLEYSVGILFSGVCFLLYAFTDLVYLILLKW